MRCSSRPHESHDDQAEGDQTLSLLIVEDDDLDAALLSETIQQIKSRSFKIVRAAALADAHSLVDSNEIDAILLDLSLPDASGLEAIQSMVSAQVDCPIIVLTGLEDEALGQMLIRAGAQDYLPKGSSLDRRSGARSRMRWNGMLLTGRLSRRRAVHFLPRLRRVISSRW